MKRGTARALVAAAFAKVRLAASAAPIAVTVEGHTRVDVEVPIERSAP